MPEPRAILAACVFLAAAAPAPAEEGVDAARAEKLRALVRQDCGSCHGMTLKGGLGPDLRAETLAGADPAALAAIILDGVPDAAMPPWRPLMSEEDARWIAEALIAGDIAKRR